MSKRTYQPNVKKAKKKHGFRQRMSSGSGQNTISDRRFKRRSRLTK